MRGWRSYCSNAPGSRDAVDIIRIAAYRAAIRVAALVLMSLALPATAIGQTNGMETRTTFGDLGILEMPSARMAEDGEISINIAYRQDTQRFSTTFQVLPWLEGSFRYSHIPGFLNTSNYYDRSFGLKLRLSQEDEIWPELSIGIRDILGTGIYGSEYIVASKRFGPFDVSAGLGWGRLADRAAFENPFALAFSSFRTRPPFTGEGGQVDFGQFFHGRNVGFFGGVTWQTPVEGVDLLAEYSTDKYTAERSFGAGPKMRLPVNVGLAYRVWPSTTITAGWFYGSNWGAIVSFDLDPKTGPTQRIGPELPLAAIRTDSQQMRAIALLVAQNHPARDVSPHASDRQIAIAMLKSASAHIRDAEMKASTLLIDADVADLDRGAQCNHYAQMAQQLGLKFAYVALANLQDGSGQVDICAPAQIDLAAVQVDDEVAKKADATGGETVDRVKIEDDLSDQSLHTLALERRGAEFWLYYENLRYFSEAEAIGRIVRVLMTDAPADVELFHLTSVKNGIPMREFRIARTAMERAATTDGDAAELTQAIAQFHSPMENPALDNADIYSRLHWSISPGFRESVFDPNAPFQFQVYGKFTGSLELLAGLSLNAEYDRNIYNDFVVQTSNSVLPHVRSDIDFYLRDGVNAISDLDLTYRFRLAPDVFGEVRLGELEMMYAGAGAQILWRPDGSRFSLGADLYAVRQRGYDQLFDLRHYQTVTGHVTAYYQSPYYGLDFAIHAGRYLANDYGATFEISRRFSTGIEIGAFATFTNVPFSKFGEGSFDKGILIRIPLEWALPIYSQSTADLTLRSLTRDGGQRIDDDDSLFDETLSTSYGQILDRFDDITKP